MDGVGDRLLSNLRRVAPVKVRVFDAQDEARDVAVPTRRKKWSQVVQTIEARPWVRVEMLDKTGAVLGYVENDGPAEDLEDISGGGDSGGRGMIGHRAMLEMMIKAQTVALSYRDKEHTTLLQNVSLILQTNAGVMHEWLEIMRAQRDAAVEMAELKAAAEAGGEMEQIVKMIEASPKLMQAVGPLLGTLLTTLRPRLPAPAPAPAKVAPAAPSKGKP